MGGKASYDTVITIKKYSNRRLYDMAHSRYLTIEELGELIQQGFDVQVVDSKTKEDITQAILTQIVMERDGIYLFSTSFLHQVI
ncbi:MAG: polyhydroxyalkanoate synthesis regulator DNA-binding domain-containing protein, partial [SAR324 cluster bacterium]|nr:polyhydroxyalkanoate synthesis regulator DNA-binding domain-containing protein [SAR324 cluster bacterium]